VSIHWGDKALFLRLERPQLLLDPVHLSLHLHQTSSGSKDPFQHVEIRPSRHDEPQCADAQLVKELGDTDGGVGFGYWELGGPQRDGDVQWVFGGEVRGIGIRGWLWDTVDTVCGVWAVSG
jgi:hypothetical protein